MEKRKLALRFASHLLPLLLFFLLTFLLIVCFDDLCFWRSKMLLGMSVAIQMPGGKKLLQEVAEVTTKIMLILCFSDFQL